MIMVADVDSVVITAVSVTINLVLGVLTFLFP